MCAGDFMTHKAIIIVGILVYPIVAFLFLCLLGFNNRARSRIHEQEMNVQKETDTAKDQKL